MKRLLCLTAGVLLISSMTLSGCSSEAGYRNGLNGLGSTESISSASGTNASSESSTNNAKAASSSNSAKSSSETVTNDVSSRSDVHEALDRNDVSDIKGSLAEAEEISQGQMEDLDEYAPYNNPYEKYGIFSAEGEWIFAEYLYATGDVTNFQDMTFTSENMDPSLKGSVVKWYILHDAAEHDLLQDKENGEFGVTLSADEVRSEFASLFSNFTEEDVNVFRDKYVAYEDETGWTITDVCLSGAAGPYFLSWDLVTYRDGKMIVSGKVLNVSAGAYQETPDISGKMPTLYKTCGTFVLTYGNQGEDGFYQFESLDIKKREPFDQDSWIYEQSNVGGFSEKDRAQYTELAGAAYLCSLTGTGYEDVDLNYDGSYDYWRRLVTAVSFLHHSDMRKGNVSEFDISTDEIRALSYVLFPNFDGNIPSLDANSL